MPSKWPQYSFALMASWKQSEKIAQFRPEALSLGTDDGRVLARAVTVTVNIVGNERNQRRVFAEKCRTQ